MESLAVMQKDESFLPKLAQSWEVDEAAKTVVLHLRDDVQFSDGTVFDADAVVWNLELYQELYSDSLSMYTSFEAVDECTVVAYFEENGLYLLNQLLDKYMISPSYYEKVGGYENLVYDICGTGPFVLESADTKEIVYKRNENYWGVDEYGNVLPYLDEIHFQIFEDLNTLTTALQSGNVDAGYAFTDYANIVSMCSGGQIQYNEDFLSVPYSQCYNIAFPTDGDESENPFVNLKVRQAACYAIDNEAMAIGMSGGLFNGATEWFSEDSAFYSNGEVQNYTYDPEKSKELLEEAGYGEGECHIRYYGQNSTRDNIVMQYLTEGGFDVEFVEASSTCSRYETDDPLVGGVTLLWAGSDWDTTAAGYFGKKPIRFQDRWPQYQDKIRELYSASIEQSTKEDAVDYVTELAKYVIDENCLMVPLVMYNAPVLWRNNVVNLGINQNYFYDWTPSTCYVTE